VPSTRVAVKRVLLGRPRPTRRLQSQLLPKRIALPVLGAGSVSSVAYATQELLLVLALAGAGALALASPLAVAVVVLLALVAAGYRQIVRVYPHGGGAYAAAKDNLGTGPGLVAAASLLAASALTVAVSVAAAAAAVVAAVPELAGQRVLLALALLAAVTLGNLRGVRETGALLALPTYAFLAVMVLLLGTGLVRCGLGV
jgi:amino acid transporter